LKEHKIENIPVVREFQDVLPQELLGMPPDREIGFTIDLIPGTSLIAQAPYKMGPEDLVELKADTSIFITILYHNLLLFIDIFHI
jgi:hypothetical protein